MLVPVSNNYNLMQSRKKITNYTIWMDTKLGEGAFGKVYYGQHDETKRKIAIKMLEKAKINKDQYYKNALFSQIQILKCLKSPNIVEFLDVMESNNYYYIVQQYCNGGQLRKYMNKIGKLSEQESVGFLKQVCNGFYELAKEGVVHRDLKPENVLIHDGTLKIADFGFSKKGFKGLSNQTVVGTPLYMSLQILMATPYTSKCDVWSLGCVFYEMLHGKTPWAANSEYELIMKIQNTPLTFRPDISETTKDFLRKCLAPQQNDRLSWDQVFSHPIFNGNYGKSSSIQNKFKSLMNHLRYMIKTKNIDLERYFANMKFKKGGYMNFQQFRNFILYIDDRIDEENAKYVYDRIVVKKEVGLGYEEIEKVLMKFGIPISPLKMKAEGISYGESPRKYRKNSEEQYEDSAAIRAQASLKLSNTFFKLKQKIENRKMTIYDVFEAYGWNQKGYLNSSDFAKLLRLVDNTFTQKEIQICFQLVDPKNVGTISVQGFISFLSAATHMPNTGPKYDWNTSTSTNSSLSSQNSLSYPVQYTNGNALVGLVADEINRFALNPQLVNMSKQPQQQKSPNKRKGSFNSVGGNGWF